MPKIKRGKYPPTTRKLLTLYYDLKSVEIKLLHSLPTIQALELVNSAVHQMWKTKSFEEYHPGIEFGEQCFTESWK